MSIGKKLRSLRLEIRKTLREQSEAFGVSINTVYRWEHDLAIPRRSVLIRMADFYNVPVNWLLSADIAEDSTGRMNATSLADSIEQQLFRMFRKLSDNNKYKVLGYVERICIEGMD